ncbi:carbohydrate kinase family protein [Bacillus kwashiorkori]|uniref:carbohydrate kinase family protein n=1 Tax=Bacillus kwashiorkori TaxID=1522318 RepID=UPI000781BC32|nr:carbohydrate kinase family protein [Bacillus kwashiorkori]
MLYFDEKMTLPDKNNDILTVGELLIDMISDSYSDNFDSSAYHKYFGGSPANIAMNVKKLGITSLIASAVGKDGLGKFLINQLHMSGIDTSFVQEVDYATSMVLVTKSKSSPVPIFYREADYHLQFTPHLKEAVENAKIIHFSCWPISKMPARSTIEDIIQVAKAHHSLICFDPNYHPMIWERDENGIDYIKSIIGKTDIIKPSEDDAERLFGKDIHEKQIEKFLKLGAKLVIMTLGKDGAIVSNGKETIKLNTLATEVVDTTGAGDAFWSGFYTGIVKGYTIKEALNIGMAVSAYKLKFTGAVVDLPKLEKIKEMYRV